MIFADPLPDAPRPPMGPRGTPGTPEPLLRLFLDAFEEEVVAATPIASDGSRRKMTRLTGASGRTAVGVLGPDAEENLAFLSYSRSFRSVRLNVPLVYGEDLEVGAYLVEDLGDTTLFKALVAAREREGGAFPASMVAVYRRVLEALPRFQVEGGRVVDYSVSYPRPAFDRPSMLWDLNYFKYHFLRLAQVPFNEDRLELDFDRFAGFLLRGERKHFLYRDFQSRNVMLRDGVPWFVDYQGGRRGALAYDVASLLYDAKAEIPQAVRDGLLVHYLDALAQHASVDATRFLELYPGFVVIRILQALGAYGYRGFYERKTHFLQSVPPAVRNIQGLLETWPLAVDVPELRAVLERICSMERFKSVAPPAGSGLVVRVGSFRYASGVPEDPGGHGGGFVFDCRALGNPGANPTLAHLTGLDAEVASALEGAPEVEAFYGHALALVSAQVRTYLDRGWTSLSVQFGCTGGQHRSVFLAERLAQDLRARWPLVDVRCEHAERARWPIPSHVGTEAR